MTKEIRGRAFLVGDICIDLSLEIPEAMGNAKGQEEPACNGGGTVANTAFALAKLGLETHFIGTVGDDFGGRLVKSELESQGINTKGMSVSFDRPTLQVISLTDRTGERTAFVWPKEGPAYSDLNESQLRHLDVGPTDWVHTSGICITEEKGTAVTLAALQIAKQRGSKSSFDLSLRFGLRDGKLPKQFRQNLWKAISFSSHVLGTVDEELVHLVPDESDARRATEKFAVKGDCIAVMRESGVGAHVSIHGKPCYTVPHFKVPVVDTLGAGDAFAAGLIFGGQSGKHLPEQVRWGHAVAGYKVGGLGSRYLPNFQGIETIPSGIQAIGNLIRHFFFKPLLQSR